MILSYGLKFVALLMRRRHGAIKSALGSIGGFPTILGARQKSPCSRRSTAFSGGTRADYFFSAPLGMGAGTRSTGAAPLGATTAALVQQPPRPHDGDSTGTHL